MIVVPRIDKPALNRWNAVIDVEERRNMMMYKWKTMRDTPSIA
jgi:hypothetical protein